MIICFTKVCTRASLNTHHAEPWCSYSSKRTHWMSLLSSNSRKLRLSKTGRQTVCRLLSCLVSEHQHKWWCSPACLCTFFVSSKLSFPITVILNFVSLQPVSNLLQFIEFMFSLHYISFAFIHLKFCYTDTQKIHNFTIDLVCWTGVFGSLFQVHVPSSEHQYKVVLGDPFMQLSTGSCVCVSITVVKRWLSIRPAQFQRSRESVQSCTEAAPQQLSLLIFTLICDQ